MSLMGLYGRVSQRMDCVWQQVAEVLISRTDPNELGPHTHRG